MASTRSFSATWHFQSPFDNRTNITKSPNGRFWSKRKMNNHPPEATTLSSRPDFPPQSSSADMMDSDSLAKRLPQPTITQQGQHPTPDYDQFVRKFHQHTLSDSSNPAISNESSPTTTISTVDDSSATEPSPGSSPESPPPTTFAVGMLRPRTADDRSRPFFELQKQPPPRKGRNLKNLAVVTSRQPGRAASTTSLPLESQPRADSTILSPSFVKPPTPPRRRPSNLGLTILTPGGSKPPPQEVRLTIPPTPGFGRPGTLRHFQSSPSLPLVPRLSFSHYNDSNEFSKRRVLETILSPIEREESPQIVEEPEEEEEQNFDIPLSQEEKPEAYPDGPICVYDPHIDLYLEPTAEQARKYDVILNVASEVRNPFAQNGDAAPTEPDLRLDGGGGIQYAPKRPRPITSKSYDASSNGAIQMTLEASSVVPVDGQPIALSEKDPEYIHIPWEHNSDIVPDLLRLVKLIDEKANEGKRVLVHCQCGVSRSASLVVAYGLYKNPSMSVQEAYNAVKKRSKWIGPNMNLIMQLQEFRSSLARGGVLPENRALSPLTPSSAASDWRGPFSNHSSPLASRDAPMSAVAAPAAKAEATENGEAITPGPSSAPSGFAWPLRDQNRDRTIGAPKPSRAYVDTSGHVVPVLKFSAEPNYSKPLPVRQPVSEAARPSHPVEPPMSSPRSAEFAMAPLLPSRDVDPADSFGIMSPTSTEFASNPFDRTALLASLGMGSMRADEETPRRSLSLRNREVLQQQPRRSHEQQRLEPQKPQRRLRGKISSPTLREQQQLQEMQSRIEASLSMRNSPPIQHSPIDEPLMSPRATEFTNNPFALPLLTPARQSSQETLRETTVDPRSPAHKGASPITRNILDVL